MCVVCVVSFFSLQEEKSICNAKSVVCTFKEELDKER